MSGNVVICTRLSANIDPGIISKVPWFTCFQILIVLGVISVGEYKNYGLFQRPNILP